MSEASLQAGLYEELHEYAELIDGALVELKGSLDTGPKSCSQELGAMLVKLKTDEWQVSPARLLVVLLSDFSKLRRLEWAKVGEGLLSGHPSSDVITRLEGLATVLEEEQVNVMSRMKDL
jgi:hypothetical protein